jgi:hypothetical protein
MSDWFYSDQLLRHLKSLVMKNTSLITLAPELMEQKKKDLKSI